MQPATLHEKKINIISTIKEMNMSLFLSGFFEACGIISTRYDMDYLPKKMLDSDYAIYIVEEDQIAKANLRNEENLLLVHTDKEDFNCYTRIDTQNCGKILNYLFEKWDVPQSERDELNDLFQLYAKNDIWRMSWLVDNVQHGRLGDTILAGEQVKKYIEKCGQNMQKDLSDYKNNHSNNKIFHYLEHMVIYCLYRKYDLETHELKRFKKYDELIAKNYAELYEKNDSYLGYVYLRAKIHDVYLPNYSFFDYKYLKEKYPQSEILCQFEYFMSLRVAFYKKSLEEQEREKLNCLERAYRANPTNYIPLKRAAKIFWNRYHYEYNAGNDFQKVTSFYNKALDLLQRFQVEEYPSYQEIGVTIDIMQSLSNFFCMEFYASDVVSMYKSALISLKEELQNKKLFENIFASLAYHDYRNEEIENSAKEKILNLTQEKINRIIRNNII